MSDPFQFTAEQVAAISPALRRRKFPDHAIAEFVAVAASEIEDWRQRWPPVDAERLAEGRRRLKNLADHLDALRFELNTVDTAWKIPLWSRLSERTDLLARPASESTQAAWKRTGQQVELMIEEMRRAVAAQRDAINTRNGRDNARRVDLVERLAWTFHGCFNKMPTTTPDGPFMEAVEAIGDALGERIGKDAVASGIAEWRAYREFWSDSE